MAQDKKRKPIEKDKEVKFISKEELQKMRFKLSIEIPKEDFDELVKAMMGMDKEDTQENVLQ